MNVGGEEEGGREDDCRLLPGDIAGIPQNVEHKKNHFLLEYVKTKEPTGMHIHRHRRHRKMAVVLEDTSSCRSEKYLSMISME